MRCRHRLAPLLNFLLPTLSTLAKCLRMSDKHDRVRENPHLPVTNLVTYVPKPGKEAELLALVKKHEPALRAFFARLPEGFEILVPRNGRPEVERVRP